MSDVVITEGTQADLPRACTLWFLADEGPPMDAVARDEAVQTLVAGMREVWQRPPVHLLLAMAGDRLVGTVFGKPLRNDASTGQISMLAVHPDWQRVGIGARLLDAVLGALAADGCSRSRLYVVAAHPQIHAFYEKRGWLFTGDTEASPDAGVEERIYVKDPIT